MSQTDPTRRPKTPMNAPAGGSHVATRTAIGTIGITYGTAIIVSDAEPGREIDERASVAAFRALVKDRLTETFGPNVDWKLQWGDAEDGEPLTVLLNGKSPNAGDGPDATDTVREIIRRVRGDGDYLVYSK